MLLAVAEPQKLARAETACKAAERFFADERGTLFRQLALGQPRERPVEKLRRDKTENRITEKLEALVALRPAVAFVRKGRMRERRHKQRAVLEFISDFLFECVECFCID